MGGGVLPFQRDAVEVLYSQLGYIYIYIYICVCVCMCVCVCVCVCFYIYEYTPTYMYISVTLHLSNWTNTTWFLAVLSSTKNNVKNLHADQQRQLWRKEIEINFIPGGFKKVLYLLVLFFVFCYFLTFFFFSCVFLPQKLHQLCHEEIFCSWSKKKIEKRKLFTITPSIFFLF